MKKWTLLLILICSTAWAANEFRSMVFKSTVDFQDTVTFAVPISLSDNLEILNSKQLKLFDVDNSNYLGLRASNDLTSNLSFILPESDGTSGQALVTDGSGQLSFETVGGSGEVNTASNLGAGFGVFANKVGFDLQFKSLVAGSGISLSSGDDEITIVSTGGGGADVNLSNLVSVAINSDLIFGPSTPGVLKTPFDAGVSNSLLIETGQAGANGGALNIGTGDGGNFSGDFHLYTGAGGSGYSGSILIETKQAGGETKPTGNIVLKTSPTSDIRGEIKFIDGTESISASVWTNAAGTGVGHWVAPSFADIHLSNIVAVSIPNGSDLIPANDNGISVGSSDKAISTVYTYVIQSPAGGALAFDPGTFDHYDMNAKLSLVDDPAVSTDAATKNYVDVNFANISLSNVIGDITLAPNTLILNPVSNELDFIGHIKSTGTAPTVTADCGTSPSVSGTDRTGLVTVGTGGVDATCTITFASAWGSKPRCFANNETTLSLVQAVPTITTLVLNSVLGYAAGALISYHCESN